MRGVLVIKATRTFRMFLRTIASTAVSGIGQWDRMGQEGVDLCLTCRAEDGRKLMSVNQLGDGHVEVFVSSSLDPHQFVIAHEGLRGVHLDREVLGDGIDDALDTVLKPPLIDASEKVMELARGFDGVEAVQKTISEGLVALRICDEDKRTYLVYFVANEDGHFCYYRADLFDLAVAMIASVCYQKGFHLCMLSSCTGIHRVKAFNEARQDDELLAFEDDS